MPYRVSLSDYRGNVDVQENMDPSDRSLDKVMDKRLNVVKVRTSLSQPYPTLYP